MRDLLETWIVCLLLRICRSKVLDDSNNFAKPSRQFTAAQARDQIVLSQYVCKDKAY